MKINTIRCDGCKTQEETEPIRFGGNPVPWIVVHKPASNSSEKISAGVSHFCTEDCLIRHLARPHKTVKAAVAAMDREQALHERDSRKRQRKLVKLLGATEFPRCADEK